MFRKKSSAASHDASDASYNGPSLMGILAGKKFAKRLSTRFAANRKSSGASKSVASRGVELRLEPTYRMEPQRKFQVSQVVSCIQEVMETRMKNFNYSPQMAAIMGRLLSEEVKQSVKAQCYERYKIIACVTIGEKKGQGLHSCSRAAWDDHKDNFAEYSVEGENYFCSVSVFGIYAE